MGFRASKFGWSKIAARVLLVPVIAGAAGAPVQAQIFGGSAAKARTLTAQANQALQNGDLTNAEKLAKQAQAMNAQLSADEPKPENVLAQVARMKAAGPAAAAPANVAAMDAKTILAKAKDALTAGRLDEAQDLAAKANQQAAATGQSWGLFGDTPAGVLKDVQEARGKLDRAKSEQLFRDAKAVYAKPAKTDAERMANLDQALNLAYQAKNLHGPYAVWDFGDKPDGLISQVETAKGALRKKVPAAVSNTAVAAKDAGKAMVAGAKDTAKTMTATAVDAGKVVTASVKDTGKSLVNTAKAAVPEIPAPTLSSPPEQLIVPAMNPAKDAVAKLVAEGRAALKAEKVLEAKAKAGEARMLAEKNGLLAAFAPSEDSPDALFQATQAKGQQMIAALTKSADDQMAAKKTGEAAAALEYAKQLSDGLGMYSKPIDDKMAALKPGAAMLPTMPSMPDMPKVETPGAAVVQIKGTPVAPNVPSAFATGEMMVPTGPAVPVVPAATLMAQAAAEMGRGDLEMARKIALQAHTDPAAKADAQAMLRQIDAAAMVVKQRDARAAFDNGCAQFAAKKYDAAMGVFQLIDPSLLPADCRVTMADMVTKCDAGVKLAGMQTPAPAGPDAAKPGEGLADQQKALADVGYQKLRQDGFDALTAANAAWGRGETDAAIAALTEYAARVKASSQTPSRQAMLTRPIDARMEQFRILKHTTDFLAKEATDKTAMKREMLTDRVAETQKQDEIKRIVRQVAELTKAQKFREAEAAALQGKNLDPDDPTLTLVFEQAKNRRRVEDFKTIRSDQEQNFLTQMNDAEKPGPSVTIDDPLRLNPVRSMNAARRGEETYMRARTQQEVIIENKLSAPFSFEFKNATLRDVIGTVRQKTGLNVVTDDAAIDDEKIALDAFTVTEEVKDLALRDGLTILLAKARLAHVVENNVVKVTTEKRSKGRLTTKVFHVMDLVTPIPEYAPAPHHRMDTALAQARSNLQPANPTSGPTPYMPKSGMNGGQMVSNGATGVPGSAPFLGGAGSLDNSLTPSGTANAMSPQRGAYSDQLKKLITGMVRPYSWQAMGGAGNIEYYDIGGALVVNQTADVIKEVQDLLESLRRLQDLSVAVEIRVISLSEAFFERVGVDFSMNVKTNNASFERQIATNQFRPEPFLNDINARGVTTGWNPATGGFTRDLDIPIRSTSYALTEPSFGGYSGTLSPTLNGGLSLGLAFLNDIQVYMFLEAAQGNRRVNVMQAPKVTLFNGQTATIFAGDYAFFSLGFTALNVGGQIVYQPNNTAIPIGQGINPNTGTPGGVSVTVQAVISADRRFVRLNLSPSLTALATATVPLFPVTYFITPVFEGGSQGQPVPFTQFFQQPSFTEITAQTTVAVPDGGTVLLGGLKTNAQSRNEFGPPVVSQVPYLNRLFKNTGVGYETRHVMIMVTPRIIINTEEEARQVGSGDGN